MNKIPKEDWDCLPAVNRSIAECKSGEVFAFETADIWRNRLGCEPVTDDAFQFLAATLTEMLCLVFSEQATNVKIRWISIKDEILNPDRLAGFFRLEGRKK